MTPRQPLEALLGAFVNVEEPKLKVEHGLTGDAKAEVPGLDDACVHRPDWNLEHALACDWSKWVGVPWNARHHRVGREVLAKRPRAVGPVIVKSDAHGVRMAFGNHPEEIHHLSLEPVGRRILRCDGRERRRGRIDRRDDAQEGPQSRQRPDVMQEEAARRAPLVAREQRRQLPVKRKHDSIGERGQRGRRSFKD